LLDTESRTQFDDGHIMFRDQVRRLITRDLLPHAQDWQEQGFVDRSFWKACGAAGLLCPTVPEAYGGLGLDFAYNAVVDEELSYFASPAGMDLHSDIVADYLVSYGSEAQKQHYLPAMVQGDCITAIAMTEPGAGSDLQGIVTTARRDGDDYVINGSKTFITNGQNADLIVVVARTTAEPRGKGVSLILVDAGAPGVVRGRNLDKIGQHSADTSELFFQDVRVPVAARLGEENQGFAYLMQQLPQERLSIAICAQAAAQRAFDEAVAYTKSRKAFGQSVFDFQNTRFRLAELATDLQVGWAHLDWAISRHRQGQLTATQGSAAKLWHTETLWKVVDAALQLHGGAGYMNEYPIARLWRDARVTRLYGGTSEIMKLIIGRSL